MLWSRRPAMPDGVEGRMGQADALSSNLEGWPPLSAAPRGHGPCPPELHLCSCERCCRGRPRCAHPHLRWVDRSMMRGSPGIKTRQRQDSASCKPLRADHQAAVQASTMRAWKSPSLSRRDWHRPLLHLPRHPQRHPPGAHPCIPRAVPGTAMATTSGIRADGRWRYGPAAPAAPRHRVSAQKNLGLPERITKGAPSRFSQRSQ
jgi:hypothetical protein